MFFMQTRYKKKLHVRLNEYRTNKEFEKYYKLLETNF